MYHCKHSTFSILVPIVSIVDESRSHSIAVVQSFPACTTTTVGDFTSVESKPSSPGGHSPDNTTEEEEKVETCSDPSQVKEEVEQIVPGEPEGQPRSEGGEDVLPSHAEEGTSDLL